MPTALESKAALRLVKNAAVSTATGILRRVNGSPAQQRATLLELVPPVIAYYSDGSAALAADFYDDERERANASGRFMAEVVVLDRTVKIRRGVAWAADPLFLGESAEGRLSELVGSEVVRPYRDTILTNRRADPQCIGWKRVASPSSCAFCRMVAGKGSVYREETARFAGHDNCSCTAAPVFLGGTVGPEATALQYTASKRARTPAQKAALRDAIAHFEGN